jgi:DNA-binding response OmpR family regulator
MDVHRARLLVIDDDPMLGNLVARMLASEHDALVLTSGREALARIGAGQRFELILCDLMMPELTGVDFYERLGPIAPELVDRVVFVTGGAYTPRTKAFLEQDAIAWLEKPFSLAGLRAAVREHLVRLAGARSP